MVGKTRIINVYYYSKHKMQKVNPKGQGNFRRFGKQRCYVADYNKDSAQDKFIDNLLREIAGCSDKELLDEFESACNLDFPLPGEKILSDEFERIWARIQEERTEANSDDKSHEETGPTKSRHAKIIKGRFGWKRLAAIGLVACLMAGSGCMVAMGTKSYFYRESNGAGNGVVFDNDMNKIMINREEEVYPLIQKKLNIKPLKMGYMPDSMRFLNAEIGEGYVHMEFSYENNVFYFIQSKYNKEVSYKFATNSAIKECLVYNKWLNKDLEINKEVLDNGRISFETTVITGGASYSLLGTMKKEVFQKIVEELSF